MHGNGSSSVFYDDDQNQIQARVLNQAGVSCLFFNNRGAHYINKLDVLSKNGKIKRRLFGMAYEKIKDCIKDIDAALDFLQKSGYKEFYLVGESTGANKICVYNYYKPKNRVAKYILLSGGDDVGIYYDLLGRTKFFALLRRARAKIKARQGEAVIPDILPLLFSYQGFYDIANPDGDYNVFPFLEAMKNLQISQKTLWRHFKSLNKPTLVVYGDQDKYAWGSVARIINILKEQKPEFVYKIIKGGDHGFSDKQKELGKIIADWLYD